MLKKIWFIIALLTFLVLGFLAGITLDPTVGSAETNAEMPPVHVEKPKPTLIAISGKTDLKSPNFGDPRKIQSYLEDLGSPLAPYSVQIANSQFWATIIGICSIEQYNCTKAPYNNYWGIMTSNGLRHFASISEAITYMDNYFTNLYPKRNTVESLRGYYCASACTNWESTVLKVKKELENL